MNFKSSSYYIKGDYPFLMGYFSGMKVAVTLTSLFTTGIAGIRRPDLQLVSLKR
jgi:hypothetical protein